MEMSPLSILLIVLVAAGIWALVELALTIRKTRGAVDEVARSANETIEQVQPVIAKLDGAMDDLQPSIKQVDPMVAKAQDALDEANESLRRVNGILGDVSTVSGTAAGVTDAVNQVTTAAADGVSHVVSKLTGVPQQRPSHLRGASADGARAIADGARDDAGDATDSREEAAPAEEAPRNAGYVTYGEPKAAADDGQDNGADAATDGAPEK
ncbi:MAG: hypothetical protein ACI38Z_03205 [Parafannyhessea sp.]|uniref:hypothetical protein n=1 Tax=Parafannyhessea sp. TaxID=2847324 RepID=UPI003F037BF8